MTVVAEETIVMGEIDGRYEEGHYNEAECVCVSDEDSRVQSELVTDNAERLAGGRAIE